MTGVELFSLALSVIIPSAIGLIGWALWRGGADQRITALELRAGTPEAVLAREVAAATWRGGIDARLTTIDTKHAQLGQDINNIKTEVSKGFDQIRESLEKFGREVGEMNRELGELAGRNGRSNDRLPAQRTDPRREP